MKHKLSFLWTKIKLSTQTSYWVMQKKRYASLVLLISFLFYELIYWIFNLSVLFKILSSNNVSFFEKMNVLISPFSSMASTNGIFFAILMIILSLIQGVNISLIIYSIRHQQKIDDAIISESSFITLLAMIGLGCPSCGTSLITPVVATFVSGSSVIISEKINYFVLPIAVIISFYSFYSLGLKLSTIRAKEK